MSMNLDTISIAMSTAWWAEKMKEPSTSDRKISSAEPGGLESHPAAEHLRSHDNFEATTIRFPNVHLGSMHENALTGRARDALCPMLDSGPRDGAAVA